MMTALVISCILAALFLADAFVRVRGALHERRAWTDSHFSPDAHAHIDHPISGNRKVRRVTYHPCGCRTSYTADGTDLVWLRNCEAHLQQSLRATCRKGAGELV